MVRYIDATRQPPSRSGGLRRGSEMDNKYFLKDVATLCNIDDQITHMSLYHNPTRQYSARHSSHHRASKSPGIVGNTDLLKPRRRVIRLRRTTIHRAIPAIPVEAVRTHIRHIRPSPIQAPAQDRTANTSRPLIINTRITLCRHIVTHSG